MPFTLILEHMWRWFADTGINLALLIVLAMLVPRAGRLANRYVERQVADAKDPDEGKSSLAIAGVVIYIVQLLAYFLILVFFLQQVGFSLAGAAIPATVVSAAVGFGAQNIIADFVAGFFILSEKQYGVGDLVTFKIGGDEITGDVIQITMRATQVRTLEQYTVTIPNSTAQVCINNSNVWSRALVVVPVPLARSHDVDEVIARAERAARKALANPEIAPLIRGELMSQPGIEINPPNTVGMPWTLDIRFMVRCSPGDQFPIERALRVHILEEFFDEYGSETATPMLDDAATQSFPAVSPGRYKTGWSDSYELDDETGTTSWNGNASTAADTSAPTTATLPAGSSTHGSNVVGTNSDPELNDMEEVPAEEDPAAAPDPGEEKPGIGTFGGRIRASTGLLITLLLGLLILRGLTMDAGDASEARSGILAPPRSSTSSTESSPAPGSGNRSEPASASPTERATSEPEQPASSGTQSPAPAPSPKNSDQRQPANQPSGSSVPSATNGPASPEAPGPASTPKQSPSASPIA
ncbi:mechanosensitive ion channel family protein [Corynebacterium urinipleomorphum]|uniref:mechanosensitive ion channel family protein n=1 Tax=Corynebacterium urinipleomorphum TaxID=1852380 RepID=UPI000B358D9C|nr:mechanosensitive ion channel family protein [Corynebacterium urinipleomorphum]